MQSGTVNGDIPVTFFVIFEPWKTVRLALECVRLGPTICLSNTSCSPFLDTSNVLVADGIRHLNKITKIL